MRERYYVDVERVLTATRFAAGAPVDVRDFGLRYGAVARPSATAFGQDAYPDLRTKAAALPYSLVRNHTLVDGNKRATWSGAWVFLEVNGERLGDPFEVAAAEKLVRTAATGTIDVPDIADSPRRFATQVPGFVTAQRIRVPRAPCRGGRAGAAGAARCAGIR